MSGIPYDAVLDAPGFRLGLRCDDAGISAIDFLADDVPLKRPESALARAAAQQIAAYLADPGSRFALPLKPAGTSFQRRVWQAIAAIPSGETRSYGEIARALGSAPRAVGQACGANPYPLVIPCHRVVGAAGIGGFAHARDGLLLAVKRWLLAHESSPGAPQGARGRADELTGA